MHVIFTKDRIGALLLLAFSLIYGYLSQSIRLLPFQQNVAFHARTMPEILTVLAVVLALLLLLMPPSQDKLSLSGLKLGKGLLFLLLMSIYGLTLRPLGFIISTSLFLIIGYALLGERRPLPLLLASVPLVVVFWLLMTKGLDVFIEPWPNWL